MVAVVYAALTVLVGGMALLAQWGRKNMRAEISLTVILLALSFLLAAVGVFAAIGLFVIAGRESSSSFEQLSLSVGGVAALLAGIFGLVLCVPPLRKILGGRLKNPRWADPPVFLALWLFVMLLAYNAVSVLIFPFVPDIASAFPAGRISPGTIFITQVPFLVVAVLSVGPGIQRTFRQVISRLGYERISLRQLGVVGVFIPFALTLSFLADALFAVLQPDLYQTVGNLTSSLFNPQGMSLTSAVLFALLIGLGAGLGEETLFRGALQPALGILPASVLFASIHIQYGPSILLGYVFLLAVGLGLLRRYINTTASFIAHAGYNFLGILFSYFFGAGV